MLVVEHRGGRRRQPSSSRSSPPTWTTSAAESARDGVYPDEHRRGRLARAAAALLRPGGRHATRSSRACASVVFALQNLVQDPPFSSLDLVSCRNLLIYLEPEVQKKLTGLFHFALREGGTCSSARRRPSTGRTPVPAGVQEVADLPAARPDAAHDVEFPLCARSTRESGEPLAGGASTPLATADMRAHALLEQFAPAAVLIDRGIDIL